MECVLEAFCLDDLGNEIRLFGVRSTVPVESFVSYVSKEFVTNANDLYLNLNNTSVKAILNSLETEYEQAIMQRCPQKASLLAMYMSLAREQRKAKDFYIISNDTKYPLKFSILKFFDFNLKPEDRNTSTIRS